MKNQQKKIKSYFIITIICISTLLTACKEERNAEIGGNDISSVAETPDVTIGPDITELPVQSTDTEVTGTPQTETETTITDKPVPTKPPVPTSKPEPIQNTNPTSTKAPIPEEAFTGEIKHSVTAIKNGEYLYYKKGVLQTWKRVSELSLVCKKEGSSKETTIANISASSDFYLRGDFIYYAQTSDIYRFGTDGKNKTRLFDGKGANASIIGFSGEYLYYYFAMNGEISRINVNGNEDSRKLIASGASIVQMMGDTIYYIVAGDNHRLNTDPIDRLYRINPDDSKEELYSGLDLYDFISDGNELYFVDIPTDSSTEAYICKIADNSKISKLYTIKEEDVESFYPISLRNYIGLVAADDDKLYYRLYYVLAQESEQTDLYSINTDGSGNKKLMNIYDIEDLSTEAGLGTVKIDEGYMILPFYYDDYDPVDIYMVNLETMKIKRAETGYYLGYSIDIQDGIVYFGKSEKPTSEQGHDEFTYQGMELSDFLK